MARCFRSDYLDRRRRQGDAGVRFGRQIVTAWGRRRRSALRCPEAKYPTNGVVSDEPKVGRKVGRLQKLAKLQAKKQGAAGITTAAPYIAGQWGRGEDRLPG
jgi:hypothetical protein